MKKSKPNPKANRNILWFVYAAVFLFLAMGIYVGYFLVVKSDTVIDNPYNARATIFEDRVTRGKILADDGTVLARTVTATDSNGIEVREYPYGSLFAHAVGYSAVGKTGIESLANFDLLRSHTNLIEQTADEIMGRKSVGDNMVTTLNVNLQQIASDALGKNRGAVIAMVMLIPSIGSICILQILERFNIRYSRISNADLRKNSLRDVGWGLSGTVISAGILAIFAVIFVVPTVEEWPYQTEFSLEHFQTVLSDSSLLAAYGHSLLMALLTAAAGTLIAYGAALITARSNLGRGYKRTIESIALVTNAIPGMVLGVAYLFLFSGTSLQNTLLLMVLCNIVHYFSTPYLMMKNALSKMNAGWETTAMLMGDSWLKTILRVVTPNALSSLIEVFSYYFINSMVTISALIFIAGARTMVLTTMIKQLQYVNRFNEVFVLSLLILATNLAAKALFSWLAGYRSKHSPKITKKEGIK